MPLARLNIRELPPAPPLLKIFGPSVILLGLGLGSGEVVLWPYLVSRFGMGIMWGALLGLTFQFFMNMEIERYALAHGESVFVGYKRKFWWSPLWFLVSTFVPWIWPGIIAASAVLLSSLFGWRDSNVVAVIMLVCIGLVLTFGPVLYKTVETFQKVLIMVSIPTVVGLSLYLAHTSHWTDLIRGIAGFGNGYQFLPAGISIASFLAAFAYSGAGGNLNLAQSYYVKEKGYGMGKYAGRITSMLLGKSEVLSLTGSTFDHTPSQLRRFRAWWTTINTEHWLVFWLTGAITILCLSLLAYITRYGAPASQGIQFVVEEAVVIGQRTMPIFGAFFLLIAGLTLFGTQLTIFDASSRILAENTLLLGIPGLQKGSYLRPLYYLVLWLQIIAGIIIFSLGFREPLMLITFAAVLNAIAMFVHVIMTVWINTTILKSELRTSLWRRVILGIAACFYAGFGFYGLAQMVR